MKWRLVVVGTSLGGMSALKTFLSGLPKQFPLPVVIVQHRAKTADSDLSTILSGYANLPLQEVEDKAEISPGVVYLAPADYHLLIQDTSFSLSIDSCVSYARPSIDVLFDSAAACYGDSAVGVILTGSSDDGAQGAKHIEEQGGLIIIQDPSEAESAMLPQAALKATQAARVLPLAGIAPFLAASCQLEVADER